MPLSTHLLPKQFSSAQLWHKISPYLGSLLILLVGVLFLSGCQTNILHNLPEDEANRVASVLNAEGIAATTEVLNQAEDSTYVVKVARTNLSQAWKVLADRHLPRRKQAGFSQVFEKQRLLPSPDQERAMLHYALSGELTKTLRRVDGVLDARVHVVSPKKQHWGRADTQSGHASVLLKTSGKLSVTVEDIQRLVAGGVENLSAAHVEVVVAPLTDISAATTRSGGVRFERIGPFSVAVSSKRPLLFVFAAFIGLICLLSLTLLALWRTLRRRGRLQETLSAARKPAAPQARSAEQRDFDASMSMISRAVGGRGGS